MKRILLLSAFSLAAFSIARAEQRNLEFLQRLRDRGLGDMAVTYLQQIEAGGAIPSDLVEVFDLEYARCLIADADSTANVDRASQNQIQARTRLEKFLNEHAEHPDAALAHRSIGQISLSRGERLRKSADFENDAARKNAQYAQARAEFEQARPAFHKAIELFQARLNDVRREQASNRNATNRRRQSRVRNKDQSEVDAAADDWLEARYLAAQVDYLIGLTYVDPMDAARVKALQDAAKGFDEIFQGYRGTIPGKLAHFWHGRTVEAQGDNRTALDIYQEVLGSEPNPGERDAEQTVAFYADVVQLEIKVMQALKQHDAAFEEASGWLDKWKGARRLPGYQAIALEFARMLNARAEQLDPKKSEKPITEALAILNDMARIPGPLQTEAIRLRRDLSTKLGRTLEINTFADAVAYAEGAMQSADWKAAVANYDKALELSKDVHPVERIDSARLERAKALWMAGDMPAAFDAANQLARESPPRELGPPAAVLAMKAALNLVVAAADKPPARKRLQEIADYTKTTWPKRAEADEATISLARLQLVEGANDSAIAAFESLESSSERYPQAQFYAAQTRWRVLQGERRAGNLDADALNTRRGEVIAQLQKSLQLHQAKISASQPAPDTYEELRLLLAEALQDADKLDEALAMYEPLVSEMMQAPDTGFSNTTRRLANGAAAVYLAQGKLDQARAIANFLLTRGDDVPPVNNVLVNVAQRLVDQWKAAAEEQKNAGQPALVAFIEKLSSRQQTSLAEQIRIGTMAADLGRNDIARQLFAKVTQAAQSDAAKDPRLQSAITGVQARLVGLLRREAEAASPAERPQLLQTALTEVDGLLKKTPRAMEPNLERARILQALAETDPSKYPEAVSAWTKLRVALSKAPKKPPEYYEIVYGAAEALAGQANNVSDAKAAAEARKQAQQLLKATLALSPDLSGPEMVDRYNALLGQLPK